MMFIFYFIGFWVLLIYAGAVTSEILEKTEQIRLLKNERDRLLKKIDA